IHAYVRTLSPTEATYVPTIAGFKDIPTIRDIWEREPGVEVTGADFADVSCIIANWVTDKRARLTELANNNTASGTTGACCFAGVDPDITTVADMDRHTARFRCDGRTGYYSQCPRCMCSPGADAFVTHAIKNHEYGIKRESRFWGSDDGRYYKNGTDVAAEPSAPADDVPKAESSSWVCGHCTEYVGGPETLQGVTAHVRTVCEKSSRRFAGGKHKIVNAVCDVDYGVSSRIYIVHSYARLIVFFSLP
ncbi:hypothetical protein K438DRAFT_1888836, partial [Mycena galopus ATCC 62051]